MIRDAIAPIMTSQGNDKGPPLTTGFEYHVDECYPYNDISVVSHQGELAQGGIWNFSSSHLDDTYKQW